MHIITGSYWKNSYYHLLSFTIKNFSSDNLMLSEVMLRKEKIYPFPSDPIYSLYI